MLKMWLIVYALAECNVYGYYLQNETDLGLWWMWLHHGEHLQS